MKPVLQPSAQPLGQLLLENNNIKTIFGPSGGEVSFDMPDTFPRNFNACQQGVLQDTVYLVSYSFSNITAAYLMKT